jgi:hypothetical protein
MFGRFSKLNESESGDLSTGDASLFRKADTTRQRFASDVSQKSNGGSSGALDTTPRHNMFGAAKSLIHDVRHVRSATSESLDVALEKSLLKSRMRPAPENGEDVTRKRRCYKRIAKNIQDSVSFSVFTTLLTIYALVGDDIRIIEVEKNEDVFFSVAAIIAMSVFAFEVINQTIAVPGYFLSFFFVLDIISTISMLFDIEWTRVQMQEAVQAVSGAGESTKSSKTARIGAKAGRVIRLLRLVRLLKLYKAFSNAANNRLKITTPRNGKEQDTWGDDELDAAEHHEDEMHGESNTGKKLQEVTVRKIILLALILIFDVPSMFLSIVGENSGMGDFFGGYDIQSDDSLPNAPGKSAPRSAQYGAELVFDNFVQYVQLSSLLACSSLHGIHSYSFTNPLNDPAKDCANSTVAAYREWYTASVDVTIEDVDDARTNYQRSLLQYIYYHLWFIEEPGFVTSQECPNGGKACSKDQPWQLFWVGMGMSSLGPDKYNHTALMKMVSMPLGSIDIYEREITSPELGLRYSFGRLPKKVKNLVEQPWDLPCNGVDDENKQLTVKGFSLLDVIVPEGSSHQGKIDYQVRCPDKELRKTTVEGDYVQYRGGDRSVYKTREEDPHDSWRMYFFFDKRLQQA